MILQWQHIFNSRGEALRYFLWQFLVVNGNKVVIILCASPHCQHQKLVLIVFLQMIVAQDLADVLAVGRNDPLLHPDFAPIGIDRGFPTLHKGVQQQRRLPCIRIFRKLNIELLFLLVIQEVRQILLLLR